MISEKTLPKAFCERVSELMIRLRVFNYSNRSSSWKSRGNRFSRKAVKRIYEREEEEEKKREIKKEDRPERGRRVARGEEGKETGGEGKGFSDVPRISAKKGCFVS